MLPYREQLTSLLVSAMITSTLVPSQGLVAQAGVVNAAAAQRALGLALSSAPSGYAPAPVSSVRSSAVRLASANAGSTAALPAARLQALVRHTVAQPPDRPLSERLAVPLGLSSPGVPYITRQLGFDVRGARHAVAAHPTGTGKVLFMYIENGDALLWVCDMNGTLLAAGQMIGGVFSSISIQHAQTTFEAELREWSQVPLPGENQTQA